MEESPARPRTRLIEVVAYFLFVGVALRGLGHFWESPSLWAVAALLLAFLLLHLSEPWFRPRFGSFSYVYLVAQTGLVLALSLIRPYVDYFVTLYVPLSVDAVTLFAGRLAFVWIGIFILATASVLTYTFGWFYALPLSIVYAAACLFIASYAAVTRRAEEAQAESQALLTKLQAAHRDLLAYSAQVEELAATEERNRLARELHDSVTQTIFSLTLTAQATRLLLDRDLAKAAGQLDRVQELAQDALAEMRSLIQQLRPKTVAAQGLVPALREHISQRQSRDGLNVVLHLDGEGRLPTETEEALFRIVQEALNNVVKHAQTDQAQVALCWEPERVRLRVEDAGLGFDPNVIGSRASHLGLVGMRERVKDLGGTLNIQSHPGAGTRIQVEVPLVAREENRT